tara:strand:+ start:4267 stop:4878 length:612 start_codon:yes stop_codon:yes gene_type:complete
MQSTLNNSKNIICKILSNGGIAILPTDTIYSLSCITSNTNSLKKILKIKGRDAAQGMPVLVPNIDYFNIYAKNINSKIKKIINKFMPGPLTLILNKKPEISDLISGPNNTIALRIPDNADLIDIMNKIKSGITGTSANLSGKAHSLDSYEIIKDLGTKVDIFVFGDYQVENKKPSTILDVTSDKIKIIREGAINKTDIYDLDF